MRDGMSQNQRLDYLVDAFRADSARYKHLPIPEDPEGKRRMLRSLMNIRMPGHLEDAVLAVQDAYLQERVLLHFHGRLPLPAGAGGPHRGGDCETMALRT